MDVLTPLGRGQALLLTGTSGSGKSLCVLDIVLGQSRSGVRCVVAAVGQGPDERDALHASLHAGGAMAYTTVVAADAGVAATLLSSPSKGES